MSHGFESVRHHLFGIMSTDAPVSPIKMLGSFNSCNAFGNSCLSFIACMTSSSRMISFGDSCSDSTSSIRSTVFSVCDASSQTEQHSNSKLPLFLFREIQHWTLLTHHGPLGSWSSCSSSKQDVCLHSIQVDVCWGRQETR
jgi:hypothetical protein